MSTNKEDMFTTRSPLTKKIVSIVGIQLLLGAVGLFFYPFEYMMYIMLLPWMAYLLALVGGIPFAGFLIYFWLWRQVVENIYLPHYGLHTTVYTTGLWLIYQIYAILFTIRSTGQVLPDVPEQQ